MNLRSRAGITIVEMLLYAAVAAVVLNMTCVIYGKSLAMMKLISRRCEDLQGLDLVLRDIKRDGAAASAAEITPGKLTLRMPGNRTQTYTFSKGILSRNGVRYFPELGNFRTTRTAPDLLQVRILLPDRMGNRGRIVSTTICMRNAHETPER